MVINILKKLVLFIFYEIFLCKYKLKIKHCEKLLKHKLILKKSKIKILNNNLNPLPLLS